MKITTSGIDALAACCKGSVEMRRPTKAEVLGALGEQVVGELIRGGGGGGHHGGHHGGGGGWPRGNVYFWPSEREYLLIDQDFESALDRFNFDEDTLKRSGAYRTGTGRP